MTVDDPSSEVEDTEVDEGVPLVQRPSTRTARMVWITIGILVILVIALVVYALVSPPPTQASDRPAPTAPSVLTALSTIPASQFDSVGVSAPATPLVAPRVIRGDTPLQLGGKPEVLFVGTDYCPFCAAERWPLVIALSRFGRFKTLHNMQSSPNAVFPSLQSFTFTASSYESRYLSFVGVELFSNEVTADGSYTRVATLTPEQTSLLVRFGDGPTPGTAPGQLPFVDIGNGMVSTTSGFSPGILATQSQADIVGDLSQPGQPDVHIGPAITASANYLTAGICQTTGQQPTSVCTSKGVEAAKDSLGLP